MHHGIRGQRAVSSGGMDLCSLHALKLCSLHVLLGLLQAALSAAQPATACAAGGIVARGGFSREPGYLPAVHAA